MPDVKIRLELQHGGKRKFLRDIEAATVPRVGEKLQTGDLVLEVVDVVHTPLIRDWDAVILLKETGR